MKQQQQNAQQILCLSAVNYNMLMLMSNESGENKEIFDILQST